MLSGLESVKVRPLRSRPGRTRRVGGSGTVAALPAQEKPTRWWITGVLMCACLLVGGGYTWFVTQQATMAHAPLARPTVAVPGVDGSAAVIESVVAHGRGADATPFDRLDAPSLPEGVAPVASQPFGRVNDLTLRTGHHGQASLDVPSEGTVPLDQPADAASGGISGAAVQGAQGLQDAEAKPRGGEAALASNPSAQKASLKPKQQSARQRRQAAREADAASLAALVAHVSANSRREVNGTMPPLRLGGSKAPPMYTIAQIVGYCRSLTGEEAKQCRVQICENYWGKDDACSTRPSFHRADGH